MRIETTDRAVLLWIRWLFFLVLSFLALYTYNTQATSGETWMKVGLLFFYAATNALLTWATRRHFKLERWSRSIFLGDILLVTTSLYYTAGADSDLYLFCFIIIYLSALIRRVRDAAPLAILASILDVMFLYNHNKLVTFLDPPILLRFPLYLVLSLFSSYLSEQADLNDRRMTQMKEVQAALAAELEKATKELLEKQNALVQAEKITVMSHMAGALAHKIRNPLCVIIGYASILLKTHSHIEDLMNPLAAIRRSADVCIELMENLSRFSRHPKEAEAFHVESALLETITLVRLSAKMSNVECHLEVRDNPTIRLRRLEFQQIFINLMNNALEAMLHGGTLNVIVENEVTAHNQWLKVSVKDTGEGIAPELQHRIFEPFFTTKAAGEGAGLGLSMVRDIVASFHGAIEVQSELHKGTIIVVRLPLDVAAEKGSSLEYEAKAA